MPEKNKPNLVFQPKTHRRMQNGFDQLTKAVRATLGPYPRRTVYEQGFRDKMPEFLDDGGLIARRIIQIQDRSVDVGAMFLRHVLWEVREKVGDGTATTAVLFNSLFKQGSRYITAGGNAMRLRYYLDKGLQIILHELSSMTQPIRGRQNLAQLAKSICYEDELAILLGEIVDIVGEFGGLEIGEDYGRSLRREYIEGAVWPNSIASSHYLNEPNSTKRVMDEPAFLVSNLEVEDPQMFMPIIETCVRAGERKLVLIASQYSEKTISTIHVINQDPVKFQLLAVNTPGVSPEDQAQNLEDLAVLTGGIPRIKAAGDMLEGFQPEHLGHARQAWATKDYLGIIHGKGDPIHQRVHINTLKKAYINAKTKDERRRLHKRLTKFRNGSANLFVGGINKNEIDERKELAERTYGLLRSALQDGVLPGGGVALLACKPAVKAGLSGSNELEEIAAQRILVKALEEPIRTLIENGGYDDGDIMAEIKKAPAGTGFDVISEGIVDVTEAGILDVASVVKEVVHAAVSSAGLALTTDVIVHHREPEQAAKP